MSFRLYLMRLVALSMLPVAAFAAYLAADHVAAIQRVYEQEAARLLENLVASLDRELDSRIVTLQLLANLPELDSRESFGEFYNIAKGFLDQHGDNVVLFERDGQQVLSTRRPYGEPLPKGGVASQLPQVFTSGKPMVSNVFTGSLLQRPLIAVVVPVIRRGTAVYALGFGAESGHFQQLLERTAVPPGWTVSIIDAQGQYIASGPGCAGRIGEPVQAVLASAIRAGAVGPVAGELDGRPSRALLARSSLAQWTVVLAVPADQFRAPLERSAAMLLAIGACVFIVALLSSLIAGRRLSAAVAALAVSQRSPDTPWSGIRELDAARESLQAADAARAEVGKLEHRMATVLACTTDAIIEVDRTWRFTFVNDAARQRIAGGRDLAGQNVWDSFPAAVGTPFYDNAQHVMTSGEGRSFEAYYSPLRTWFSVRCFATPEGFAAYFQDVSDRKQAEAELQAARLAAERANEAKSRFLAAASHDLRQPFQAMTLYRDVLAGRLRDPRNQAVLAALGTAMAAGQELLTALLDLSTLEAGVIAPKTAAIPLHEVLEPLAVQFRLQAAERDLAFTYVGSSAVAVTDAVLFARMIRNLLTNALKYTTQGKVLLGCRRSGGTVRVEVWDTGPGVPLERQADIWEEFTQLHNPERDRSRGMGLGLAVVAKTGHLLEHRVGLRSWPGKGSVFFVELPQAR